MRLCGYAGMRVCGYAGCEYASMQVCRYASSKECQYLSMKVCKYARIHKYKVCEFTLTFKFHFSSLSATRAASTSLPNSRFTLRYSLATLFLHSSGIFSLIALGRLQSLSLLERPKKSAISLLSYSSCRHEAL